ncbi:hypothetical protein [Phaeodactylibacter xiamenensis]|uniref:hypothetical protein n=1 Tax=Phaeodactylibacter xiamenensis TaxID=1524460 RepID=UPI0024A87B9E|nr:hypothetical protein [Phaeodactylibacter xiamenensis]
MEPNAIPVRPALPWLHLLLIIISLPLLYLPIFYLPTTSPPEAAIELSTDELLALEAAYEQGFDHPDPDGDDPCQRLQLLPYKKLSAWRKQFRKRGFTIQKIKDMLKSGRREIFIHPEKGTRFTKIFDPKGNWIVVDFVDCIIWQVAPYNFK